MDSERWTKLRDMFERACELQGGERKAFVEGSCGEDQELRDELERMLEADSDARRLLESSPMLAPDGSGLGAVPQPDKIGRYDILHPIGAGGMGIVYEARQEHPTRRVALKMLRAGTFSESIRRRFIYEAEVLGRLQHPNIAQIYEAGVHPDEVGNDAPYFAMEYVPGARDLRTYVRDERISFRDRLALFAEVCDAVHYGHQKGVIHRDLKPANILVDEAGRPKVIDFGVARVMDADANQSALATRTGEIIGTLRYMSPEQLRGDRGSIDTRTDVYALGFVLYELLCDTAPYDIEGKSLAEAAMIICEAPAVDPRRYDTRLPPDASWVVLRALEKERERRYASASELAADVRRVLAHEPVAAGPPSTIYRMRKFVRRHRVVAGAAVLVAFALAGGAGVAAAGYVEAADEALKFRSMNEVLTDVLVSVQTGRDGRDVRVAEMLDRVAVEIDADLAGRPEVAAALHTTLAESYHSLALNVESEQQARRALELWAPVVSQDSPERLRALGVLVASLVDRSEVSESEHWISVGLEAARGLPDTDPFVLELRNAECALAQQRGEYAAAAAAGQLIYERASSTLGSDHETTLSILEMLVSNRAKVRVDDDETMALARELLEARVRVNGVDSFAALDRRLVLAWLYLQRAMYDEAQTEYDEALPRLIALVGDEHPRALLAMTNLASLYSAQREPARAAVLLERVVGVNEASVGPEHPATLLAKASLAAAQNEAGDVRHGDTLRETLDTQQRVWGKEHPRTISLMFSLGIDLTTNRRYEEAGAALIEAIELSRRVNGEDSIATIDGLHALAYLHYAQSDFEHARPYFEEAWQGMRRVRGQDHPSTLRVAGNYAVVLGRLGAYAEAIPVSTEVLAAHRDSLKPGDSMLLTDITNLGQLYLKNGDHATAEGFFREALDQGQEHLDPDDPWLARAHANLAQALHTQDKSEEALSEWGEAIARAEFNTRVRRWDYAGWLQGRAGCLRDLDRLEESETDLLVSYESVRAQFTVPSPNFIPVLTELVALYDAWDRPEERSKWQLRLDANVPDD